MRNHDDPFGRDAAGIPQIEKVAAQGFRGEHVELRERLVEQQDVRVDDERPGKADALPHPARELFRIGGLEAVEPDQVDRIDRAAAPLGAGDAERLEAELDIAEHRQPREQRKGLKHHGNAVDRLGNPVAAIFNGAIAWRHEAGEDAQKRRLARPRFPEDRDDLAVAAV